MEKVLKHEMVPKHEVLSEKEADELLNTYNISSAQLPIVLITDPALKGLDVKNGDVVKVTRENRVTGTSYVFRLVATL